MTYREKVIKESEEAIDILSKIDEPTFYVDFVRCAFENALTLLKSDNLCEAAVDLLVDLELTCICDDMSPCDWCEEHCKSGQASPDRECWEHFLRGE